QLLFARNRRTVYDGLSTAAAIGFSLAALLLPDTVNLLLPASYLAFGLMWCVSCLCKVPLTAWYSMKDYNGDSAMQNPLFVRTNRILTMAWGVLYVLTSVWTYFLMGSEISSYIALINNIVPIAMGIFTKWFQNWYPAHYASK
ncbi:MAG: NAD(P)H dehydrogenase, partial [Clostridia bacterium]|nr:NAD(P)H dehydrogenase [Clostridia bacterium]